MFIFTTLRANKVLHLLKVVKKGYKFLKRNAIVSEKKCNSFSRKKCNRVSGKKEEVYTFFGPVFFCFKHKPLLSETLF